MSIVYDPSKTPQEMADAAGVSLTEVRNFLQRNFFDYRADRATYLREQVEEFFDKNPEATEKEAVEALKMSLPTIKKYLRLSFSGADTCSQKQKKKSVRQRGLSVGNTDGEILRDIINIYFPKRRTFDCDLTFGRGEFYAGGLQVPKHRYDKYLFDGKGSKKYPALSLDEAYGLPDGCFESVVIDLPISIDNSDSGVNAFKSLSGMFDSYHDMLSLASRLLKKGGILVFKTSDFVLRNDSEAMFSGQWATDHAIDYALELGFDLTDRFILARRQSLQTRGSMKIRTGLKHGYFLIFTKIQ